MRVFAFLLLLIGGASAGAAWQGYGWEDLRADARCALEENRLGCEEEALDVLSRPEPHAPIDQAPSVDRTSCGEMRGTDYRSPTEREWFLANCVTPDSPDQPRVAGEEWPEYDLPAACEGYDDKLALTSGELKWFMENCGCWATDISFPPCRAHLTLVAVRTIPFGMPITEEYVKLNTVLVEDMNGEDPVGYEVLGRMVNGAVGVGRPILRSGLRPIPADEVVMGFSSCEEARNSDPNAWAGGLWQWFAVNCFSCEVSGTSPLDEEREWYERNCLSQ